ncbi:MAG: type II CRISPR RNA-guided endonuclease Cas9 [Lentisphaerae bacterium]|nr:type II CRISPR RNA-guided endonuclease Cas9 [Lentisphaerota bacterium]
MFTLGLDLGISSVGWALLREDCSKRELVAWGSRIFEPGVEGTENDIAVGKGVSRCAERRLKKALRTQYSRRRRRKKDLLDLLIANGLLPENVDSAFFCRIDNRLLMLMPKEERARLGHVLPYLFRKMALDRVLEKHELGRALYHLAQRRGYLSNRKQELKDQDETGKVKSGINALKQAMAAAGARTLGEYFSMVDPEVERIRSRYTERAMYQDEFRKICQAQRKHISAELEEKLFRAIFSQRKLKSCKGLVGKCRIYPERRRCSMATMEAQLFRIYDTVSKLRITCKSQVRSLTEDERLKAVEVLNGFNDLCNRKGKVALSELQKAVGLGKGEKFSLGDDDKEIYANELHNILYRAFGDKAATVSGQDREKFFNDLRSIEKNEVLHKRLTDYWQLSEEKAAEVSAIALPDKYSAFSLKALQEMLPDMAGGVRLSDWLKLNNHTLAADKEFDRLPLVDDDEVGFELRNPIVHRVLTEMRRVVNSIVERYGKPDKIHVELARDLKATNEERRKIDERNKKREKEREAIAKRIIAETGLEKISRNDILKVMLADECDFTCPYSGERFSMSELLDGGLVHIEHIIPYSRSFDDSFANKTLCVNKLNAQKSNNTPYEAFGNSADYPEMLERVRHFKGVYAERKLELFKLDKVEPSDFMERNLNDTRYASKLAMQYLAMLYGGIVDKNGKRRVYAIAGGCTALIRRAWGGNYLLGEGEKVRDDHRHHAVDAMTIALTTPALVQEVARMTPERRREFEKKTQHFIDSNFYQQAKSMLDDCAVSHHVVNKMRGALHKETIYSKDYSNGGAIRHKRIELKKLTKDHIANIVDPAVKNIILDKLGVANDYEVTNAMLKIFGDEGNYPQMLDRNGNAVNTIKKVRIACGVQTRTIGNGDGKREVATDDNYILAIFAKLNAQGEEIGWVGEVVTLMDAVQKKQRKEPLFEKNRPGMKFKFSLQKGDIVKTIQDGKAQLGVIRAFSSEIRIEYCSITDARIKKDIQAADAWNRQRISTCFKVKMQKYNMNVFGELQIAND